MLMSTLAIALVAAADPAFLTEARASQQGSDVVLEVRADGAIDAKRARAKLSSGVLTIEIGGTRARRDNRSWGDERRPIRAHRHSDSTEIEMPVGVRGCEGPVEVAGTPDGTLVATVRCGGGSIAPAPRAAERSLAPRQRGEGQGEGKALQKELRAEVALAETETADPHPSPLPLARERGPEAEVKAQPQPQAQAPTQTQTPPQTQAQPAKADPLASAPAPTEPAPASPGVPWPALAALVALGGAGYLVSRRKKAAPKMIRILETTSLGPKRSLIVAKLGDETLVLGASEAGISVLKSKHEDVSTASEPAWAKAVAGAQPALASKATDEAEEPEAGQVHFLTKLFGRRSKPEAPANDFEDLFASSFDQPLDGGDSVEDQELRQKLAMGLGARTR